MKTVFRIACLLLAAFVAAVAAPVLAGVSDYAGDWACIAVDLGDGNKLTEYEGTGVGDLMKLKLGQDGSLVLTSIGGEIPGTWAETADGVSADIEGQAVAFTLKDGQLVNTENGVMMYLEKAAVPKSGGLLSLVKGSRYAGRWVVSAVDEGDGVLKDQYQGMKVSDVMAFEINRDGTLVMTSMGFGVPGTWAEITGGIRVTVDGEPVDMLQKDEQLVASENGLTLYFTRGDQAAAPTQATAPTQAPMQASGFAGAWEAVRYESTGYSFDIKMLFPDGCIMTLRDDGTGEVPLTKDYMEQLTWSESGGTLSIQGSYVFSAPVWNAEKGELSMFYGSSAVSVVFQRTAGATPVLTAAPMIEPTLQPTAAPTPEPTVEPTAEPMAAPTMESTPVPVQAVSGDGLLCETNLFTALFPGAGWSENTGWRSDRADYSSVRIDLKDEAGSTAASVSLSASSEGVRTYRDKIKLLKEYAGEKGQEVLDEALIGGVSFQGISYERWGWKYAEYAARVPEAKITLMVTIEQPDKIGDRLQPLLDFIAYKLPLLSPPNVDPPLPEDGAPFVPEPATLSAGDTELSAKWLKTEGAILLDSIFGNVLEKSGDRVYVLAGKTLYAFKLEADRLVPDAGFAGGRLALEDEYEYLSLGGDGTLLVSNGMFNILSVKDGAVIADNDVSGYLVMHPGGEWGLSFWVNADTQLVRIVDGELKAEPWLLTGLSDPATRKGRFSSITSIFISDTKVYVAGTDELKGGAQRVAAFDLEGNELFTFGAEDWTADDAFGSVTGITETGKGILVLDGNYRVIKLFSPQGEFLGQADSDALLGTDYPWLSSMVSAKGGVLVAAAQARQDESADELLIFLVSGF